MSLLPFLALAFGAGALSLLTRRRPWASAAIGVAGLALGVVSAATIGDEAPLRIAGGAIAGTRFAGLFLLLGCAAGILLSVIALATSWPTSLPGTILIALGAAGLALGVVDAGTAAAAATGGAVAAMIITLADPGGRGALVGLRELRAVVVAGILALVGAAVVAGPLAGLRVDPAILGIAYLAFALAVAIRLGAIPFHLWAARVADATPAVGLPLVMAWGPAAFAIVGLAWIDGTIAPLGEPLSAERLLVGLVGLASILFGTAAALVHDDVEHVVGYSIVADAGVALLGLAALDPAAWEPTRTWLVTFVVAKSAFAGWAAALRWTFGGGRLGELGGWALRSPLLALALVGIAVASVGWPGLAAFGARDALIDLAFDGPLAALAVTGGLATAAIYGRLFLVGFGRRSPAVAGAEGWRPAWPGGRPRRLSISRAEDLVDAWTANRVVIAASAVLVLAGLAAAVSGGGLGVREAAAGLPPSTGGPGESLGPGTSDGPAAGSPEPSPAASPAASTVP